MPFLLVQLRPCGDKRGSWYIRRSDWPNDATYRDKGQAEAAIRNTRPDVSLLVLTFDHLDALESAFKLSGGEWKKPTAEGRNLLQMAKRLPT